MVSVIATLALTLALGYPTVALADPTSPPPDTSVKPGKLSFDVAATDDVGLAPGSSHESGAATSTPASYQPPLPPCGDGSTVGDCEPTTTCMADALSPSGGVTVIAFGYSPTNSDFVLGPPCDPNVAAAGPSLPVLVLRAFQRIPLPEPHLEIQPPKGKTLIGLETIYSTGAEPFDRTLTLLGQRIELRIHATSYDWSHGDGTSQNTDWAGRPWERGIPMERYISHVYEDTGSVKPTVRVTWTAEYRVNHGAWQPVNGTVDRGSPAATLVILEAEPKLVAP